MFSRVGFASLSLLFAAAALTASNNDEEIKTYIGGLVSDGVKIENIRLYPKKKIENTGAYLQPFVITIKNGKVSTELSDTVVVIGDYITTGLYNMVEEKMAKDMFMNKPSASLYTKQTLIAGSMVARNKAIVFSDPFCPICKEQLPRLIQKAKSDPQNFAVFLYHFPITTIHTASPVIIKSMLFAKKKGFDITELVYSINFKDANSEDISIGQLNESLSKNNIPLHITKASLGEKDIVLEYKELLIVAKKLWITSTPSVYTNQEIDYGAQNFLSKAAK